MSNTSLKEQLQAVASQLENKKDKEKKIFTRKEKSKKLKPQWLEYVQYGVELLKVYFPLSFKSANEIKPLKKGIKQDLIKRLSAMNGIAIEDKACMLKSLAYYVNTTAYHKVVIERTDRIDLDGNPEGTVNAEEAKYSAERYKTKLQAKHATTLSSKQGQEKLAQLINK